MVRYAESHEVCTFLCEGCQQRFPLKRLYESRQEPRLRIDGHWFHPRTNKLINYVCSRHCDIRAGQQKALRKETFARICTIMGKRLQILMEVSPSYQELMSMSSRGRSLVRRPRKASLPERC